jgi:NAD-dependent dihydropyrimidine dehydrogenase PreA subunit/bacterioferritin-associated ferredoxin
MKKVIRLAVIDPDICNGCTICYSICPVVAITMKDKKAIVATDKCLGCVNCEQRCPAGAVKMVPRETFIVGLEEAKFDRKAIVDLCAKTHFYPEHLVCTCTGTRAWEIAAAILDGARSPEEISAKTGIRTGCKAICLQPILRFLEAAAIEIKRPDGYQWYGITPTLWDLPEGVIEKYSARGFGLAGDKEFIDRGLQCELEREGK